MDEQRMMDIYDDLPPDEAREQIAREQRTDAAPWWDDVRGPGLEYAHQRCYVCDGICIPTGTCHTCQSCGETTGCG